LFLAIVLHPLSHLGLFLPSKTLHWCWDAGVARSVNVESWFYFREF